jgi:hypothetical protein
MCRLRLNCPVAKQCHALNPLSIDLHVIHYLTLNYIATRQCCVPGVEECILHHRFVDHEVVHNLQ